MSWREQLRTASFRGVEFLTEGAEVERGRRLVVHEYPQRDEPDVEDLGRRARRFPLTIYLLASRLGPAYWPTRDRLIEALERGGPGTLVHPYHGSLEVHVESFTERYTTSAGGRALFECVFIEHREPREPRASGATARVLIGRADLLEQASRGSFLERFTTIGFSEFVRDAARAVLDRAADALAIPRAAIGAVNDAIGVIDVLQAARAELATLGLPRIRETRVFGGSLLAEASQQPAITPSERQIRDNTLAVAEAVVDVALAASSDAVAEHPFESVDEAHELRDEMVASIDERAEVASDPVFAAVADLRAALVSDIEARGANLARLVTFTPAATLPSVVIAHRLYGDASRAGEIERRNRVRHPGFVAGGVPLEVLTDV